MYKFLEKKQEILLSNWYSLRQQLEKSDTPLEDVFEFFNKLPKVRYYTDPFEQERWPTAWELVSENQYCQFNLILGICFTLQLTSKFKNLQPKIAIMLDNDDKTVYYLLYVDDKVCGYDECGWISVKNLPKTMIVQKIYHLPSLH